MGSERLLPRALLPASGAAQLGREPPLLAHSRHKWPFIQTQTPFLPGEFLNLSASVPIYVMGTVCLLEGLLGVKSPA